MNDEVRALLRHHLAALAFRFHHAVAGAPDDFERFSAGNGVRTPGELVPHVASVLDLAAALLQGEPRRRSSDETGGTGADAWPRGVAAVHDSLERLDAVLLDRSLSPNDDAVRRALHGPLVDAATHVGQLVMLRRLAGSPVAGGSYVRADVRAGRLGTDQPDLPAPHDRSS